MARRTVGIDLAVRGDHVARVFDDGRPVGRPLRFRATADGLQALVAAVTAGLPQGGPVTAVMEPTGMAWFAVALWLRRAGVEVIRVKGQRVRALRRYLSEHAKSDAADAHVLGVMPPFGGAAGGPLHVPDAERHALQRLTRQRDRLEAEASAIKRRLIDLARWACPALEKALPDFRTRLSLAVLHDLLDPRRVLRARRATPLRFVAHDAAGDHPHGGAFAEGLAGGLRAAAAEAPRLHGEAVDFARLQLEAAFEADRLRLVEAQITALSREIEAPCARLHPPDAPRPIPGVGEAFWRRCCSACRTRRAASAASGGCAASAACPRRPAPRAAPRGRASASPSPATTASSAPSASPPTRRGGSTRSSPPSTGA